MSLFSEKMLIFNRCISGSMSNLIEKSWKVSTMYVRINDQILCTLRVRKNFIVTSLENLFFDPKRRWYSFPEFGMYQRQYSVWWFVYFARKPSNREGGKERGGGEEGGGRIGGKKGGSREASNGEVQRPHLASRPLEAGSCSACCCTRRSALHYVTVWIRNRKKAIYVQLNN